MYVSSVVNPEVWRLWKFGPVAHGYPKGYLVTRISARLGRYFRSKHPVMPDGAIFERVL